MDVLRQVSSAFAKNFSALVLRHFEKTHPFEILPVPFPVTPWVVRSKKVLFLSGLCLHILCMRCATMMIRAYTSKGLTTLMSNFRTEPHAFSRPFCLSDNCFTVCLTCIGSTRTT